VVTRSLTRVQAVLLGGAVVLGLILGTVGLFAVGSRQWFWNGSFHLRAGFARINGVEAGTRVRVLGRDAGEVEQVVLPEQPSGPIVLVLRLDGRVRKLVRADAVAQIVPEGMVGGKVIEIQPGSDGATGVEDFAQIGTRPTTDLSELLAKVNDTMQGLRDGQGSLGKLLQDDAAYREFLSLLQQGRQTLGAAHKDLLLLIKEGRGTVSALKQDAEAIKEMPLVRSYVTDFHKELVRPDCQRHRKYFAETDLFEPGNAVLTSTGRQKLDEIVPWLNELKLKGSEVTVVSYAPPTSDPDVARTLTAKQSKAVADYLTNVHSVHKMGWFSWSRRVTPLGGGNEPPPLPEKETLPLPRTEVLVFVPQN
jgi:phospholipid/cholesterol/gamma-HCH transport system substrate-binding protein